MNYLRTVANPYEVNDSSVQCFFLAWIYCVRFVVYTLKFHLPRCLVLERLMLSIFVFFRRSC